MGEQSPQEIDAGQGLAAREGLAARKSQRGAIVTAGALVTTGVALAVLAAVILVASLTRPSPVRQLAESQLRAGDCLGGSNLNLATSNPWHGTVMAVPCTQQHFAEIFFVGYPWPRSLAAYPGDTAVASMADIRCSAAFAAYVGIVSSLSEHVIDEVEPNSASDWAKGDREVVCVASGPSTTLRHSIKGTHQ